MTAQEQLDKWVNGESVHNDERDECCPDFSCCNNKINTPQDVRERFAEAYKNGEDEVIHQMLMRFLGDMLSKENIVKGVHVVGNESDHTSSVIIHQFQEG